VTDEVDGDEVTVPVVREVVVVETVVDVEDDEVEVEDVVEDAVDVRKEGYASLDASDVVTPHSVACPPTWRDEDR
jgi:hypothetical protein